jgi:hypothetical protein
MVVHVGFSKTRRTTGIACLAGDHLTLERVGTAWKSRETRIPAGFKPSVNAINRTLLALGADLRLCRYVKSGFKSCSPLTIDADSHL